MAKTTSTPGKLTQTQDAVDKLILEAGKASATMTAKAIEAAKLASKKLDASKPLADRIAMVMAAHSAAFATAGHNVKAIFSDALTLLAAPSEKVMVPTFDAAGKKVADVQTAVTADKAVDLSKHTMRDAAKQVREAAGIGRKTVARQKVAVAAMKETDDILCNRVLSELGDAIKVAGFADKLIRFLDVAGFACARKVKVSKQAAPAPVKTMAELPGLIVQGTATAA
jgi:hypothetical protein